ncbi:uncharacterized protein HGUI_01691 [Hanseniaspora guilliermondii]|uniref:SET domain-containing protein n=1 Tax=Hanseniaspora guilliermondii TaxID=56406 RepID=A0A1L0B3G4_9ASCO|nr:uncharacterized protein HGUI_01691 [Hanseniaspora guilliermondii]
MSSNELINQQFLKWCETVGIDFNNNSIVIKETPEKNRHLITEKFIPNGTILFKVPYTAMLNPLTSEIKSITKQNQKNNDDSDDDVDDEDGTKLWKDLVVCIHKELQKGEKSQWYPYLSILPTAKDQKFDNLYYWNNSELELLKPSKCVERIGNDKVQLMYEQIQDLYDVPELTKEEFLKISSIIMSYSFDVNGKSMVPVSDLLNASWNYNSVLEIDDEDDVDYICMVAKKDIKAGDELLNIYGNHPNGELLRMYGYVEDDNQNEFAEIDLDTITKLNNNYTNIIDDIDESYDMEDPLIMETFDVYKDEGIVSELVVLCEILTNHDEDMKKGLTYKQIIKKTINKVINNHQISNETRDLLVKIIDHTKNKYEVNPLLKKEYENKQGYSREYMASVVIKTEYQCLMDAINILDKEYTIMENKELEKIERKKRRMEKKDERKAKKSKK